jgi:hypothetical protein
MCRRQFQSDAAGCLSFMFGSRVLFILLILALAMGMPFPRDLRAQQVTAPGAAAIVLPGHERDVERAVEQVREATLKDPGCAYFFVTTRFHDHLSVRGVSVQRRISEARRSRTPRGSYRHSK